MISYGFNKKNYGEDSKKYNGHPRRHSAGTDNTLRHYKKIARQITKNLARNLLIEMIVDDLASY